MLERYVTAPDGMEWVVGRKFLFGAPRYIGFRFGRHKRGFEPARTVQPVPRSRLPEMSWTDGVAPAGQVTRTRSPDWPVDQPADPGRRRGNYRHSGGPIWIPTGNWGSSGGRSGWSGGSSGSSGGSRGNSSGGSRSGGSGGDRKGGGGGAAGGIAGLGGVLVKFLKVALIVILVVAAILFTVFVLLPVLIFLFWSLFVVLTIAWHSATRRPWVVEAREHRDAPRIIGFSVVGWAASRQVIHEVAEAIAEGRTPDPSLGIPVDVFTPGGPGLPPREAISSWPPTIV